MAYATVEDVSVRTKREFRNCDASMVAAFLEDAAAMIDAYAPNAAESAKAVVSVRMVIRAIGDGSDGLNVPIGATQGSMGAGGYTQSWTIGSGGSTGELYLSKADKKLLGVSDKIGSYSPVEELVVTFDV